MNSQYSSQTRRPFSTVHSMLNSRPPLYASKNFSTKNISQVGDKQTRFSNTVANSGSMKRSQTMKNVKLDAEPGVKQMVTVHKTEADASKNDSNLQDLLKSTNANIGELRSEIMKLETKCLKLETEKLKVDKEEPYLHEYRRDLLKELKEENHKLSITELKLKGDYNRIKEQNSYLEAENVMYKEKLANERAQNELKEESLNRMKRDKADLERKLAELERSRGENEREKFRDIVDIRQKEDEIKKMNEKLIYEREDKQRFIKDLKAEIERNSRLQLDNDKLKVEGRSLVELIESLKLELQILKRNNEETLNYIRYS